MRLYRAYMPLCLSYTGAMPFVKTNYCSQLPRFLGSRAFHSSLTHNYQQPQVLHPPIKPAALNPSSFDFFRHQTLSKAALRLTNSSNLPLVSLLLSLSFRAAFRKSFPERSRHRGKGRPQGHHHTVMVPGATQKY